MKYHAFLSYSHASDHVLAPALQTALHRFAKPWNRLRALRVFRDQTSLAASPELWPALLAELAESAHFLLLASPAAAASRWVRREIDWWLDNRSPQTMLILLTDGTLAWDEAAGDFDWAATDALPDTLRGRFAGEPLWVDLRFARAAAASLDWRRGGAFRAAVLDIAAPLHGRSKDELDGEDVRQLARVRRLRLSAVSALAVLTAGALAAASIAWLQRNEALRQNEIAQAGRLAVHADLRRERRLAADDSALLAAEAVRRLDAIGARSLESDLSLRRALALLPRWLGEFAVPDYASVVLGDDGRQVVLRNSAGGDTTVRRLPNGEPAGCHRDAIAGQLKAAGLPSSPIVATATRDGSHCATVQIDAGDARHVDIWSSAPLQRIDSVSHRASGNSRLLLTDGADLLAITEPGHTGNRVEGEFRVWSRSRQADVLAGAGEFIAFGANDRVAATSRGVWRLPAGGEPATASTPLIAFDAAPAYLAFSRSGRYLAVRPGYDSEIAVYDLERMPGKPLRERAAPAGDVLALSDDGRTMVLNNRDSALLWDAEDEVEQARLPARPHAAVFAADTISVVVEAAARDYQTRVAVYDLQPFAASQAALRLPAGDDVRWLALAGERVALLAVTAGGGVRVDRWDAARGGAAQTLFRDPTAGGEPVWAASGDGLHVALARADGVAVVGIGEPPDRPTTLPAAGPKSALALDARGQRLAIAVAGGVTVVEPSGGGRWQVPALPRPVEALRLSDDGTRLLALLRDDSPSRIGPAYTLRRWRLDTPFVPAAFDEVLLGRHTPAPDLGCLVDGDGDRLLLGQQHRPRIAEAAASAPAPLDVARRDCAAARGGALRATIEFERELLIGDSSGRPLVRLEHADRISAAAIGADGGRAATADATGTVQLWPLDAGGLIAQLCRRSPRPLGDDGWRRSMPENGAADACGRPRPKDRERGDGVAPN